jgi:FxsC-like protein
MRPIPRFAECSHVSRSHADYLGNFGSITLVALFVLSYARGDGEGLVRKFFDLLQQNLREMHPKVRDVGFMDTNDIPVGAVWQDTLGGQLQCSQVLVPVFSPNFFASEDCGREVQAFLERRRAFVTQHPAVPLPRCIVPVVWRWDNLTLHPCLKDVHYDHKNYPRKYRAHELGLKMLAFVSNNRDPFRVFTEEVARVINGSIQEMAAGHGLPVLNAMDYRKLASAFADGVPRVGAAWGKAVDFAYVAPSASEVRAVRADLRPYGPTGRDWKAFEPACDTGIGRLSESVAARVNLQAGALALDTLSKNLDEARLSKRLVVFVVDSWAASLPQYTPLLDQLDSERYQNYPVLVPLNGNDPENAGMRSQLLNVIEQHLPKRAAAKGTYFIPGIADQGEYEEQLARVLAGRQGDLINGYSAVAGPSSAGLPVL